MNSASIHQILPHLPTVATGLLVVGIGAQAALIAGDLIPQPQSTMPAPVLTDSARPQPGSGSTDIQTILDAHLFGAPPAEGDSQGDPVDAPQTQLSLVLTGTIADKDPQRGLGLIGESATSAKVYSVGETIAGSGVRLHAVYPDRVILDRGGTLEALYLPRKLATVTGPVARQAVNPQSPVGIAGRVRQMIDQNPGSISEIIRPQPVFANGQQRGFRVYPGRNREQFARLNLQPGDLITAINGAPLDDPGRSIEIFRSLEGASEVRVTIERRGEQQELVLDMTQLNQIAPADSSQSEPQPQPDPAAEPAITPEMQ